MAKYKWSKARRAQQARRIRKLQRSGKMLGRKRTVPLTVEVVHQKDSVAANVVESLLDYMWSKLDIDMKLSLFHNEIQMTTGV